MDHLSPKPHEFTVEETYIGDTPLMYSRVMAVKFVYEHCKRPVITEILPSEWTENTYYLKSTNDCLVIYNAPLHISEGALWNSQYLKPQIFAKVTSQIRPDGSHYFKAKKVRVVPQKV